MLNLGAVGRILWISVLFLVTWRVKRTTALDTAPQLSISQKGLGTLPEDGNVMPKHVRTTIHNY
jgi:hypothetical protein